MKIEKDPVLISLLKEREALDREWDRMMEQVESGIAPVLLASALIEKYNNLDAMILELGERIE